MYICKLFCRLWRTGSSERVFSRTYFSCFHPVVNFVAACIKHLYDEFIFTNKKNWVWKHKYFSILFTFFPPFYSDPVIFKSNSMFFHTLQEPWMNHLDNKLDRLVLFFYVENAHHCFSKHLNGLKYPVYYYIRRRKAASSMCVYYKQHWPPSKLYFTFVTHVRK